MSGIASAVSIWQFAKFPKEKQLKKGLMPMIVPQFYL
jgi:hypothetical protein